MYSFGLKIAIFSSFVFFLAQECSEKKHPSQYQREDSLIRYKQLDHKNRLKPNPISDSDLLNKYDQRHHKNLSKECPATFFYKKDKACWEKKLCLFKKMDPTNFIIHWPEERKKYIDLDCYKPLIKKFDQRFITEYRDSKKDSKTDTIDIEQIERAFFKNWNQGVDCLLDSKNDDNKALPFLKAAVDVDNGYYTKASVLAFYKLANNVDEALSLLKGKTEYILTSYHKTKKPLSPQELDWCFLYNKLMITLKDDFSVNSALVNDLNHPKTVLFDVVFNDKFKDDIAVIKCLINGHLLEIDDEKYRQEMFVERVSKFIKEDTTFPLEYLWAGILFAKSKHANTYIKSFFNNKNRNNLFERINPIMSHNLLYFKEFFTEEHIHHIKNFLRNDSKSYQNKLLLNLCNIFSVCRSYDLQERPQSCIHDQNSKNQGNNDMAINSKKLDLCSINEYKNKLLTIFNQCHTTKYSECNDFKYKKKIIDMWNESLRNTCAAFLDKNGLLTVEDTEKKPALGFRDCQIYNFLKLIVKIQSTVSKTEEEINKLKRLELCYQELLKNNEKLSFYSKSILSCFSLGFSNKNNYCLKVFDESIDLLVCSPAIFCNKIIGQKIVYPSYVFKVQENLKNDDYYKKLKEKNFESSGIVDKVLLILMGTAINPAYRFYFSKGLEGHFKKVKDDVLNMITFLFQNNVFHVFPRLIFDRVLTSMRYIAHKENGMGKILDPIIKEINEEFEKITKSNQRKNFFESIGTTLKKDMFKEIDKKLPKNNKNFVRKN